jgi:hypothetical protein
MNFRSCLSYLLLGSKSLEERKGRGRASDVGLLSESGMRRCAWLTGVDRLALHASVCERAGVACEALHKVKP